MNIIKKYYKHILIGFFGGLINGFFGSGGGCVIVPALEKFLDIDKKKSHATAIAIILVFSCVSAFIYLRNGSFDFKLWLPLTIGGVIGGMLGAKLLSRISVKFLKIIFGSIIIITGLKMLF